MASSSSSQVGMGGPFFPAKRELFFGVGAGLLSHVPLAIFAAFVVPFVTGGDFERAGDFVLGGISEKRETRCE